MHRISPTSGLRWRKAASNSGTPEPRRPRLVQLVTSGFSAWGLMRGQLRFFRERGFDVTLIASPGAMLQQAAQREGVAAIGLPMFREPALFHDLASLARLARLLRLLRPDIVHFSTAKAGLLGAMASVWSRVPIRLYTLRGLRLDGFQGFRARLLRRPEQVACAAAQRVYCVSPSLRRRALELGLASPEKLRVLGQGSSNGVDSDRFQRTAEVLLRSRQLQHYLGLPTGMPVIGFVGRLVRDKGAMELLAAYRLLRREIPDLHLLLVGPFEQYDGLPAECVREIHRDRQILTTGTLDDPAPAYALVQAIALPTYREGFPNVALEAAAMEVPVVATRVTGCVDAVVDGVTGTLIAPRDPQALADALRRYLEDGELGRRHGLAGRERVVQHFAPQRIWEALYREYVELLEARQLLEPREVLS